MKLLRITFFTTLISFCYLHSASQNYHATNGSAYAGAVGLFNNPASGVNSIYKWDLNLLSLQTTLTTNNLSLSNFSYTNPGNAYISFKEGSNSYYGHQNLDINLFNFLFKIDEKHAFGIGLRGRTYNHIKSSPIYANDTISTGYSFFRANRTSPYFDAFATHNGWIELNLNYSQVLFENERSRLTGGITLNISKALSGLQGRINKLSFKEFIQAPADTGYIVTNGGVGLTYTNNYDLNTGSGFKDVIKNSKTGLGINLGVEYTLYDIAATEDNPHTPTNYSWKLGASLMDLGKNSFNTSIYSGNFYNPVNNLSDAVLNNKFSNINTISDVRDTLSTLFIGADSMPKTFTISKPTRLILNVDKNLGNNFGINGQINLNFYATSSYTKILTRETNLITVTPRWETIAWGLFLPIQYTTQGKLWVGAAFKMGPLTFGLHNIAWFKTISNLNGGGYLMISVHPFNKRKIMSRFDCPE